MSLSAPRSFRAVADEEELGTLLDPSAPTLERAVLDALASPAAVIDRDGIILAANNGWLDDMAAIGAECWFPAVGSDYLDLTDHNSTPEAPLVAAGVRAVCRGRRASFELDLEVSGGEESTWFRLSARPLRAPIGGALVTTIDVTTYFQAVRQLTERSMRDPLTGLANRALLFDHLQLALDRALRRDGLVAVAFVDLDNFKSVNDAYGHAIGDKVLQGVATRLSEAVRDEDTVARIGGDEFVALFSDVGEVQTALALAQRLRDSLAKPIDLAAQGLDVAASVGCTVSSVGATAESLMAEADEAMYRAKHSGKDRVALFRPPAG